MAPTLPQFNPARLRSYIFRLPFLTRIVVLAIFVFWILELQSAWNVVQWGALIPEKINFGTSVSYLSTAYLSGNLFFLVADYLNLGISVPTQYLSPHPSRSPSRVFEYGGTGSSAREV